MSESAYFRTPDCIFHWCETRRRARVWSAFFGRPGAIIYLLAVLIFRINFGSICINQWRTALSNLFELQRTFAKIHASLSNANKKKVSSWFASSALIYSCFTISRPRGIAFPVEHFYFPFHYSYSSALRYFFCLHWQSLCAESPVSTWIYYSWKCYYSLTIMLSCHQRAVCRHRRWNYHKLGSTWLGHAIQFSRKKLHFSIFSVVKWRFKELCILYLNESLLINISGWHTSDGIVRYLLYLRPIVKIIF